MQQQIPRCEVIPLPNHQVSFQVDSIERLRWHYGPEYPGYSFESSSKDERVIPTLQSDLESIRQDGQYHRKPDSYGTNEQCVLPIPGKCH